MVGYGESECRSRCTRRWGVGEGVGEGIGVGHSGGGAGTQAKSCPTYLELLVGFVTVHIEREHVDEEGNHHHECKDLRVQVVGGWIV